VRCFVTLSFLYSPIYFGPSCAIIREITDSKDVEKNVYISSLGSAARVRNKLSKTLKMYNVGISRSLEN
jgi:hypothetical protein